MKTRIQELLKTKQFKPLQQLINEAQPADIAEVLEELKEKEQLFVFRLLSKDMAVDVFALLSNVSQEAIVTKITDSEIKHLMSELFFDDMIDLLEEMPANVVKKILAHVKPEERNLVNLFLNYPDYTAGSLMTIEYVDLKRHYTVKESLDMIKKIGMSKETVYTCYVIDPNRKLEGIISLRKLVTSESDERIEDIMEPDVISVTTDEDQEKVADMFRKYDFLALPVVDHENRLVGIITVDDIMDVIEEENTEDMYKMAAMAPTEEPYLTTSPWQLAKNRIGWLLILMLTATLTGFIIQHFEETLASVVILAAFIPMLMDTAGNAGNQASTLIIRGLALGEIQVKDAVKIVFKEIRVSLIVGVILSAVNLVRILIVDRTSFDIALTVSITLLITVVLAKVIGSSLPIVAQKLKLDPAIMAGPLITTIVDTISLLIYFSLATMLIGL